MGADFSSYSIIGLEVPSALLRKALTPPPVEIRGCYHTGDFKFCPECGKPRLITKQKEADTATLDPKLKAFGLKELCGTDADMLYYGDYAAEDTYSNGGKSACMVPLPAVLEVQTIEQNLRQVFEPLGLWNKDKFGLWSILHCSY